MYFCIYFEGIFVCQDLVWVCIILYNTFVLLYKILFSSSNINTLNFNRHISTCKIEFTDHLHNKRNISKFQESRKIW